MSEPNKKISEAAARQRTAMGAAFRRTPSNPEATTSAPRPAAPRVKPVRTTLDLTPDLHQRLKIWLATESLNFSDVFRVLASLLLEDPALAEKVRRLVRESNDR